MEELLSRHRKEQRELQSRVTQKKKNATKKTRKGVNDECERLERELAEKQQHEIQSLDGTAIDTNLDDLSIADESNVLSNNDSAAKPEETKEVRFASTIAKEELHEEDSQTKTKKPNRQKARLARRAAEQEAQVAAARDEAADLPDLRKQELDSMKAHMDRLGMQEIFIRPDGHCLYSACALGIPSSTAASASPSNLGYQDVRSTAASFISKHPDDFSAFLEEPLESYVKKIRDTAEWGGHLELQAISRAYSINVNVLQSDGRIERFSPGDNDKSTDDIWLAYYRHSFGLGEHYNALKKNES